MLAALEASGTTDRLLAHARRVTRGEARVGGRTIGAARFDALGRRFPFVATLPQADTERVLAASAPVPRYGSPVVRVDARPGGVRLTLAGGEEVSARLVVLAGGWSSRALVYRRRSPFVYPDRYVMADLPVHDDEDAAVVHLDGGGVLEDFPLPGGLRRYVAWADLRGRTVSREDEPAAAEILRTALTARGEHAAAGMVVRATSFGVRRYTAHALRRDRLLVIGDAAHEVSPIGGQGMNLGLLDAATLAPLLARWLRDGRAPEAALARWERDRLRSARRAARLAAVNTRLGRPLGPAGTALRATAVRAAFSPPGDRAFAWAYAMGMDAHA